MKPRPALKMQSGIRRPLMAGARRLGAGQAAKTGLVNWITDKSIDIADRLYGSVNRYINPSVLTNLTETQRVAAAIDAKNTAAGLPAGKAVGIVNNALNMAGGLPYDAIKTLRSHVGELADSGIVPEGMSKGDLKQIYGALTTDLRTSAQSAGGNVGLAAFDWANGLYSQIADKRAALAGIVGADASAAPEQVVSRLTQMASGKSSADIAKLTLARKTMGADNWNEVASLMYQSHGARVGGV